MPDDRANSTSPGAAAIHLLLVEDNEADAHLAREVFRDILPPHHLSRATDGEAALRFMRDTPPHAAILDLNLPRMDGLEVLRAMRDSPALSKIPVIVMTSSEQEVSRLRELPLADWPQVGGRFLVKPVDIDEFERAVRGLRGFFEGLTETQQKF
jgi:two-component system, chemotaxis family, response regulator Rcp1